MLRFTYTVVKNNDGGRNTFYTDATAMNKSSGIIMGKPNLVTLASICN